MHNSINLPVAPEISVRNLLAGPPEPQITTAAEYDLLRYPLHEGIDILLWRVNFSRPLSMRLHDDLGRIDFSCVLKGTSRYLLSDARAESEYLLRQGSNCISHLPDCHGISSYMDKFESVSISFQPDVLANWVPEMDRALRRQIDTQRCCQRRACNAEMQATAHMLAEALNRMRSSPAGDNARAPLWLLGQSMVLLSLILDEHREKGRDACRLSHCDRQKLMRAKDLLLADLAQAPTIAELARETGLSLLKIKRGFRLLFNNSVYGLFQAERMQEAKRRLSAGDIPVMIVAADLGYTNASHFTAAFQKQFGVNPSAFKRRF